MRIISLDRDARAYIIYGAKLLHRYALDCVESGLCTSTDYESSVGNILALRALLTDPNLVDGPIVLPCEAVDTMIAATDIQVAACQQAFLYGDIAIDEAVETLSIAKRIIKAWQESSHLPDA